MFSEWYTEASLWFGEGLCHQLPERTLFSGSVPFPVCARCTGIYVGFTLALIALIVVYRHTRPSRGLALAAYIIAAIGIAGIAWDGVTSYAGLRETSNIIRLITGTAFGGSLATLVYMMLADTLLAASGGGLVLEDAPAIAAVAVAEVLAVGGVTALSLLALPVGPTVAAVAIIFTFGAVGTALASRLPRYRNTVDGWRSALAPAVVGVVVGAAGILLSKAIQAALDLLVVALS